MATPTDTRQRQIRTALIGCGRQATWILHPAISVLPRYRVVACCDINPEAARQAAQRFAGARIYESHDELLAREELDAAVVATTPENHAAIVADCLRAGLHTFVEKPPAKTVEEARSLVALSQETRRQVMVGFMMRFRPLNAWAARLAAEMAQPPALFNLHVGVGLWRSKVTGYSGTLYFLLSVGIHYFDLIRFFLGEVRQVDARLVEYDEGRAAYAMLLDCARGVCAFDLNSCEQLTFTDDRRLGGHVNERWHLVGPGTALHLENCDTLTWLRADGRVERYQPSYLGLSFLEGQAYYTGGYYQELAEFAASIDEGRAPAVTIEDGRRALEIVFAVARSAQTGEKVRVEG